MPIGSLTPTGVERMTAAMVGFGLSGRTAGVARKILRLSLRQAIRDGLAQLVRGVRPDRGQGLQPRQGTPAALAPDRLTMILRPRPSAIFPAGGRTPPTTAPDALRATETGPSVPAASNLSPVPRG